MKTTEDNRTVTLEKGDIVLRSGKDMTLARFIDWLNEKFKKESGTRFTAQDAYGYVKRGNLPYHFGVYKLEGFNYPEVGVKGVRVIDLNK